MSKKNDTAEEKNLIRRYLIWCYKTTREAFEKTERKSTQLTVDYGLLEYLQKCSDVKALTAGGKIEEFENYIRKKEGDYEKQKFADPQIKRLNIEYCYLQNRLAAIEKMAENLLGVKGLNEIKELYEAEMTRRILEAREHS
jgi:hypothetical protein